MEAFTHVAQWIAASAAAVVLVELAIAAVLVRRTAMGAGRLAINLAATRRTVDEDITQIRANLREADLALQPVLRLWRIIRHPLLVELAIALYARRRRAAAKAG